MVRPPAHDEAPAAGHRIAYGPGRSQFGDLRLPAGSGLVPAVVLVHGGFWRRAYGLDLMVGLAESVVAHGWAAWTIEYRRLGEPGGGWPGTFDDVAAAIDVLAADDGPPARVDPTRVAVVGHSAGGHLALWAAARPRLPAGSPGAPVRVVPTAVVGLAAVADLRAASAVGLSRQAAGELVGGTPDAVPDRWTVAAPMDRLPLGVPVLLLQAAGDDIVPADQAHRYADAALGAGDDVTVGEVDGDHFTVIDPTAPAWTLAAEWLRPHLDRPAASSG